MTDQNLDREPKFIDAIKDLREEIVQNVEQYLAQQNGLISEGEHEKIAPKDIKDMTALLLILMDAEKKYSSHFEKVNEIEFDFEKSRKEIIEKLLHKYPQE